MLCLALYHHIVLFVALTLLKCISEVTFGHIPPIFNKGISVKVNKSLNIFNNKNPSKIQRSKGVMKPHTVGRTKDKHSACFIFF